MPLKLLTNFIRNLSNDTFHHIVATWKADGSQANEAIKLYVDGVRDEFSGEPVKKIIQTRQGSLIVMGGGDEKKRGKFLMFDLKIYSSYHDWGPLIMEIVKKSVFEE